MPILEGDFNDYYEAKRLWQIMAIRKPHPKSYETKPFKVKSGAVKKATPRLNTKVKGRTAKLGK